MNQYAEEIYTFGMQRSYKESLFCYRYIPLMIIVIESTTLCGNQGNHWLTVLCFHSSVEMWLSWLQDELPALSDIRALFEEAVDDYIGTT